MPACDRFGLGLLPYFPLANGLLTGKVSRAGGIPADSRLADKAKYVTEERLDTVEALTAWANEHGRTLLELAMGGLAAQPAVGSVIAGATKPEQVRANVAAGAWEPSAEDLAAIDALTV